MAPSSPSTWRPSRASSSRASSSATRRGLHRGVRQARRRFEQAESGTLFLDEIGDMPPRPRPPLRVLQQGEFIPVGGNTAIRRTCGSSPPATATCSRWWRKASSGRPLLPLNVVPLRLPALRERLDDIPALAQHFLAKANERACRQDPRSLRHARLKSHDWPGNVRELENLVAPPGGPLQRGRDRRECHRAELAEPAARHRREPRSRGREPERCRGPPRRPHFSSYDNDQPPPGVYARILGEFERPLISRALQATRGNQLRAADILG